MSERNCYNCIWHSDIGCTSWDCQEMSRSEARKILNRARWRDAEKEQPQDGEWVLIYHPVEDAADGYWVHETIKSYGNPLTWAGEKVKWWMKRPEQPKEEV